MKMSRRTVLKAAGVSISLPMLDAMLPSKAQAAATSPERFVGFFFGNGVKQGMTKEPFYNPDAQPYPPGHEYNTWECTGTETNWSLSKALQPLAPHKDYLNVTKGLFNDAFDKGVKAGDNDIGHWLSSTSFLTGSYYNYAKRKNSAELVTPGPSLDYMIAQKDPSRRHLVLGATDTFGSGDDRGVGPLLTQISWKSQFEQIPKLDTSAKVFNLLFGNSTQPSQTQAEAQRRAFLKKSVLDSVLDQSTKLLNSLGAADRRKVDEFLTSIREVERGIAAETQSPSGGSCSVTDAAAIARYKADDNPLRFNLVSQRANNMIEMIALAIQCDLSRSISFVLTHENLNYEHQYFFNGSGKSDWYHAVSHYKDDNYSSVKDDFDMWNSQMFAKLLTLLRSKSEGGENLLDHSMILYGCGMSDSQYHLRTNLPIILAGKAGNNRPGRFINLQNKNYSDFLATIAGRFGLPAKVGISSGTLTF